jgi:hypothetical protein
MRAASDLAAGLIVRAEAGFFVAPDFATFLAVFFADFFFAVLAGFLADFAAAERLAAFGLRALVFLLAAFFARFAAGFDFLARFFALDACRRVAMINLLIFAIQAIRLVPESRTQRRTGPTVPLCAVLNRWRGSRHRTLDQSAAQNCRRRGPASDPIE